MQEKQQQQQVNAPVTGEEVAGWLEMQSQLNADSGAIVGPTLPMRSLQLLNCFPADKMQMQMQLQLPFHSHNSLLLFPLTSEQMNNQVS